MWTEQLQCEVVLLFDNVEILELLTVECFLHERDEHFVAVKGVSIVVVVIYDPLCQRELTLR